uniref:Adaptin ear-binding coat-associated protein 1-like n=1 Tax=Phallusia mammillata TaxID=59560 RepID=A0A6F9DML8_9ASCI|nr:adaptin ear-binding coat-associated protein 1-like [Phallusia mammillata]
MDDYERVLLVKNECFVYKLPPRPSNRGYKAADWGLDKPQWTGRMRIVVKGKGLSVKLEDRDGKLFAKAPIDIYPGICVESVTDSSRYFVLRIMDDNGRTAFIGAGFADRGDAFDFNVALQDHFKQIKTAETIESTPAVQPNLNLQLKEGQTMRINIGNKGANKTQAKPRPQGAAKAGGIFLPPPPGGAPVVKPPGGAVVEPKTDNSEWGEFSSSSASNNSGGGNWVQF